jgi:hypothetical protein
LVPFLEIFNHEHKFKTWFENLFDLFF